MFASIGLPVMEVTFENTGFPAEAFVGSLQPAFESSQARDFSSVLQEKVMWEPAYIL